MAELRRRQNISARALEFLILTAGRRGEVIGARWSEIDLPGKVWTIPASRMKASREHRVPLTSAAVAVLKQMEAIRQSDYVFPGMGGGRIGINAMHELLGAMGWRDAAKAHGFRSTFRDWAAERTSFPRELAELSLAHSVGNEVEQAYRRTDLFEKRRKLMEAWAAFCAKVETDAARSSLSLVREHRDSIPKGAGPGSGPPSDTSPPPSGLPRAATSRRRWGVVMARKRRAPTYEGALAEPIYLDAVSGEPADLDKGASNRKDSATVHTFAVDASEKLGVAISVSFGVRARPWTTNFVPAETWSQTDMEDGTRR